MTKNSARYHKKCRLQYNNNMLERIKKQFESEDDMSNVSQKYLRSSDKVAKETNSPHCFFCEQEDIDGNLHEVVSKDFDENLDRPES